MENKIIAQVEASDRNIYLTIKDGALVSVNYSQGLGDIDLHFINKHDAELTDFVIGSLQEQDETWSVEHFFPSPYWDDQVNAIDNAIWDFINSKMKRTIKITTTKWYSKTATLEMPYPKGVKLDDIEDYLHDNASIQETIDEMLEKEDYDEDDETTRYAVVMCMIMRTLRRVGY
jgi:hypothetical protein